MADLHALRPTNQPATIPTTANKQIAVLCDEEWGRRTAHDNGTSRKDFSHQGDDADVLEIRPLFLGDLDYLLARTR